jgi:hypothetical protein
LLEGAAQNLDLLLDNREISHYPGTETFSVIRHLCNS